MSVDEFQYIFYLIKKFKKVYDEDLISDIRSRLETTPFGANVINEIFAEIGIQILLKIMEKHTAFKKGGVYEICVIKGDVKNREFEFDILTRKPALPTMNYHYKIQPNIKQQILCEFYRFLNE